MTEAISKRPKYLLPSNECSHIKEPIIMYIFDNSSQVSRLILKNSPQRGRCTLVVQIKGQPIHLCARRSKKGIKSQSELSATC